MNPNKKLWLPLSGIVLIGVAGALLVRVPSSSTVERLLEIDGSRKPDDPDKGTAAVRNGKLFWSTQPSTDGVIDIYTSPLKSRSGTKIYSMKGLTRPVFAENELLILEMPALDPKSLTYSSDLGGANTFLSGPYRLTTAPPDSAALKTDFVALPVEKAVQGTVTRISLTGDGKTQKVPFTLDRSPLSWYQLTPTGLYWTRPGNTSVRRIFQKSNRRNPFPGHFEVAPKDTLMLTTLDGQHHEILKNCLVGFEGWNPDRVFLSEIGGFGQVAPDRLQVKLGEIQPPEPMPRVLPSLRLPAPPPPKARTISIGLVDSENSDAAAPGGGTAVPGGGGLVPAAPPSTQLTVNGTPFLEWNGDYYWLEGPAESSKTVLVGLPSTSFTRFDPVNPPTLMVYHPASKKKQAIATMRGIDNEPILPLYLFRYQNDLYLYYSHPKPTKEAANWEQCLARLNPLHPDHLLEASIPLPDAEKTTLLAEPVSDGYFYFWTQSPRKALTDFLETSSTEEMVSTLWRAPLPGKR